jgi:predicted MFS family arabinose efflux permease
VITRWTFPTPSNLEATPFRIETKGLPKRFWIYIVAIALVAAGYVDFALVSSHFTRAASVGSSWIPFFYAVAMASAGLSALLWGRLFDKKGVTILAIATALSSFFAPLFFLGNFYAALGGIILWGIGMGSQESIMRAVVATFVAPQKRGSAYGMMNFFFGLFWAAGSILMGYLYDRSLNYIIVFSLASQLAAVPVFLIFYKLSK